MASGEGLKWAVRDPIIETVSTKDGYKEQVTDQGERDKRLLVTEPEFARVLQVSERESNTLSAIVRLTWDSGNLRTLTKKQSTRATDAHISIIGHITRDELKRLLTDTAAGNGFANRFLWMCAKRSKLLPEGGALDTIDFGPITREIQQAVEFACTVGDVRRNEEARKI